MGEKFLLDEAKDHPAYYQQKDFPRIAKVADQIQIPEYTTDLLEALWGKGIKLTSAMFEEAAKAVAKAAAKEAAKEAAKYSRRRLIQRFIRESERCIRS